MITAPIVNVITDRTGRRGSLVLVAGHGDWQRFVVSCDTIETVYSSGMMPCEEDARRSIAMSKFWKFPLKRARKAGNIFLYLGEDPAFCGRPGQKQGGHRR